MSPLPAEAVPRDGDVEPVPVKQIGVRIQRHAATVRADRAGIQSGEGRAERPVTGRIHAGLPELRPERREAETLRERRKPLDALLPTEDYVEKAGAAALK